MPIGKNGQSPSSNSNGQDRPVVFQKYFKSGSRTYAVQIKLAVNGRKYLVLTEGVRDSETQELKKHYIRVHDQDLKNFFAMLQETVVYLRSNRDPGSTVAGSTVAGVVAAKPAPAAAATHAAAAPAAARPSRPATAAKPVKPAAKPQVPAKPAPRSSVKPPVQVTKKAGYRPAATRSR